MEPRRSRRQRKATASCANHQTSPALESSAEPEPGHTRVESDQDGEFILDEHQQRRTGADLGRKSQEANPIGSRDSSSMSEPDGEQERNSDEVLEKYVSERRHDSRFNRIARYDPGTIYRQSSGGVITKPVEDTYSQGAFQPVKHTGKDQFINYVNGCDIEDVKPIIEMKIKWEQSLTIPSREIDANGCGGMATSLLVPEDTQAKNRRNVEWLTRNGTPGWVAQAQSADLLGADDARTFYASNRIAAFTAEPNQSRQVHQLAAQNAVNLNDIWQLQRASSEIGHRRNGWLLNAGERVQCLDWAPRLSPNCQYLATSCKAEPPSQQEVGKHRNREDITSAFVPQGPCPSRIDVWQFYSAETNAADRKTIANDVPPVRVISLCSEFGPVRDLKWCPQSLDSNTTDSLGLLAAVHADGFLRIYCVDSPPKDRGNVKTQHLKMKRGIFNARPPNTVCTSVAWASSNLVVAGCANGAVAVWDFSSHLDSKSPLHNARPCIYHPVHLSYVLTVDSCGPSRPHLLLSAAMDGNWAVTDLRDPGTDYAVGGRHRIPNGFAQWYEQGQGVVSVNDLPSVGLSPIRRVNMFSTIARTDAPVSCMATSKVHSSMLIACADGSTAVINPLRNWWRSRQAHRRYRQWWFKHDWRPGKPQTESASYEAASKCTIGSPLDFANGLARLSCGYKLQDMDTMYRMDTLRPQKAGQPEAITTGFTIHDPQSGIKALAWSCNASTGGWAAAGMGDGLVCVEDLAWS